MKRAIIVAVALVLFVILIVTVYYMTKTGDSAKNQDTTAYVPTAPQAITPAPVPVATPAAITPAPATTPVVTTAPISLPADLPEETKNVLTAASFPMIANKIVRSPSGTFYYIGDSMSGVKYPVNQMAITNYTATGNALVDITAQHDAFLKLDTSRGTMVYWPAMFQK